MHGRKRRETGPTDDEKRATAAKIQKYKALEETVFANVRFFDSVERVEGE